MLIRSSIVAPFALTGWPAVAFWLTVGAAVVWLLVITGAMGTNEHIVKEPKAPIGAHDPDYCPDIKFPIKNPGIPGYKKQKR